MFKILKEMWTNLTAKTVRKILYISGKIYGEGLFVGISVLVYVLCQFNFQLPWGALKNLSYIIYIAIFILAAVKVRKQPAVLRGEVKLFHYGASAVMLLVLFTSADYFIMAASCIYLILNMKNITKGKWLYMLLTLVCSIVIIVSGVISGASSLHMTGAEICAKSESGDRVLVKTVTDMGGWGYDVRYYVEEKYAFLQRRYLVAVHGDRTPNYKFTDEDTLVISDIEYDISREKISFEAETGKEKHRMKRKPFFWFL